MAWSACIGRQSWKYSEKYNVFNHSKWYYQHPQISRQQSSLLQHHAGKTTKYKVPKTWRKAFALMKETNKTNPTARKKSTLYAAVVTVVFFGTIGGFAKFLHFFGPAGGGRAWREAIWNEVSNRDTDQAFEQMQQESSDGYIRNMFGLGIKPKMPTLEQRAKNISPDRYRTWEDVMNKGFPRTAKEYKRVSKMRPETIEEYEIMDKLDEQSQDGRKLSNADE